MEKLKSPIDILKDAWKVFSEKPAIPVKIIGLSYLAALIGFVIFFIAAFSLMALNLHWYTALAIPIILAIPLYYFFQSWFGIALSYALLQNYEDKQVGAVQAIKDTKKVLIPYLILSIIYLLIVIGGTMLLIIPGLILYVYLNFYTYIILNENKKGFNALLTSREYVKGYTFTVFTYLLFFMIISYVATAVPAYIFEYLDLQVVGSVVSLVINFVLAPVGILYSIGIYKELKRVKGEVEVENLQSRKIKYLVLALIGLLLPISAIFFAYNTVLPVLNDLDLPSLIEDGIEESYTPNEEVYVYPEAV